MPSPPARWPSALAKGCWGEVVGAERLRLWQDQGASVSADMAARYREDMMQRIDAPMETKMKAFLAGVQEMDIAITPHGAGGRAPPDDHRCRGAIAGGSPRHRCPQQTERARCRAGRNGRLREPPRPLSRAHGDAEEKPLGLAVAPVRDPATVVSEAMQPTRGQLITPLGVSHHQCYRAAGLPVINRHSRTLYS